MVSTGVYYENIVLNKSLTILGVDRFLTVIDGDFSGTPLYVSADGVIVENLTIRNSGRCFPDSGIYVDADNFYLSNAAISNCATGVYFYNSRGSVICNSEVKLCSFGVWLDHSSIDNSVYDCNISLNTQYGIYAGVFSDSNILCFNNISFNFCGVGFSNTLNNSVFCNNFLKNVKEVISYLSFNNWTREMGGNFWNSHDMTDVNHDGVCDEPFVIDSENVDLSPLAGWIWRFDGLFSKLSVMIVSNSTIEEFGYLESNSSLKLSVSKSFLNQTYGFCRICIPYGLLDVESLSVAIDGGSVTVLNQNFTLYDDGIHRWIYFAYPFSNGDTFHEVVIIPEFGNLALYIIVCGCFSIVLLYKRFRNLACQRAKLMEEKH